MVSDHTTYIYYNSTNKLRHLPISNKTKLGANNNTHERNFHGNKKKNTRGKLLLKRNQIPKDQQNGLPHPPPLPPFTLTEMYPWIRDAAAAAAAAVSFAGSHHHPHHHHQINSNSGMVQGPGGVPINGNVKAENGFASPHNSGNECMLAIDYAHNKVSSILFFVFFLNFCSCF